MESLIQKHPNSRGRHAVREAILAGTRKVREVNMSEGLDQAQLLKILPIFLGAKNTSKDACKI